MTSQNTLGVSLDWARAIIDFAPPEDAQAVCARINVAWDYALAAIDTQPFSGLLHKPATQESLHRADSILERQVQGMLVAGKPSPLQILAHLMGITRLDAMVEIKGPDAITTEFNILDYPYPLPERAAVPTLREEFEAQALGRAVKHYGYKDGDALLKSILERRANDRYMVDWVEGAWLGYQAGIEAAPVVSMNPKDFDRLYGQYPAPLEVEPRQLVVKLPRPFMSGYTESGNCPATDLYSFDDVKSAIEAAGGSVKR